MAGVNPLRSRRLVGALLGGAAVLLVGSACARKPVVPTDVVTDTDRDRAAVLSHDPVLAGSVLTVAPGRLHSAKLGWDRTQVTARIFDQPDAAGNVDVAPEVVEARLATAIATLRTGGWTVHWTLCLPLPQVEPGSDTDPLPVLIPPVEPSVTPTPTPSGPVAYVPTGALPAGTERQDGFQWVVYAYKIAGGVSYWASLSAASVHHLGAFIDVVLRAPGERDPANLFAARPAALPTGPTCAEDKVAANATQEAGVPVQIKDWWPFPDQTHTPDPLRL
jgi:hypothetical protein